MKHREKCRISISVLLFIVTVIMFLLSGKEAEAAEKRLSSITAVYTGESVLIGDSIEMDKLTVMGLYSDGSYVKLKNYSLSTYVVGNVGNNIIKVSCEGVTGTFVVEGKRVTQISAYYADSRVTVGEQLDREKITVKVYYSDGGIEEVKDYTLSHTTVSYVGLNEYIVTFLGIPCLAAGHQHVHLCAHAVGVVAYVGKVRVLAGTHPPVGHHIALIAPLAAEDARDQIVLVVRPDAVDFVIGGHDV